MTSQMKKNKREDRSVYHVRLKSALFVSFSLVLLGSELGVGVGDADVELLGALDDEPALARGDGVRDLRRIHAVLYQQHLQVRHVVHQELLEAVGANMLGLLVAAVADVGHLVLPLETPADAVVDPLGLPPVGLDAKEVGRL